MHDENICEREPLLSVHTVELSFFTFDDGKTIMFIQQLFSFDYHISMVLWYQFELR